MSCTAGADRYSNKRSCRFLERRNHGNRRWCATATDSFTVTVANTNDAPTITSTAGTTVDEDSAYSYSITTADVDAGDTMALTFTCATCDDGTGSSFLSLTDNGDGTGTLSGTPVNEDVGSHRLL